VQLAFLAYLTIVFPNQTPRHSEYLTLDGIPQRIWSAGNERCVVSAMRDAGVRQAIVLKNPPHTSRIKILLEMFRTRVRTHSPRPIRGFRLDHPRMKRHFRFS